MARSIVWCLRSALNLPHRYKSEHVFRCLREAKLVNPAILTDGGCILHDLLRVASDDAFRQEHRGRNEGLCALRIQGPAALQVFASLLAMPLLGYRYPPQILLTARTCGAETMLRSWLQDAPKAEVLAELAQPTTRTFAYLEVVAAHAASRWGSLAADACVQALRWRYRFTHHNESGNYAEYEPALSLLPRVVASLGRSQVLKELLPKPSHGYQHERALTFAQAFAATAVTSTWEEPPTLVTAASGRETPVFSYTLALDGCALTWTSAWDIVGDFDAYEQSGMWTFTRPAAALAFATAECDAASRLGVAPRVPVTKPAKKHAAKSKNRR